MLQRSVSIRRDALLEAEAKKSMLEEQRKSLQLASQSLRHPPDIIWPEAPACMRRSSSSRFMLTSLEDMEEEGQSSASLLSGSQLGPADHFLTLAPLLPRHSPSRRRTVSSSILDPVGATSAGSISHPHEHQHNTMLDALSAQDLSLNSMVARGPLVDRRAGHRTASTSLDGGTSDAPPGYGQLRQQQQNRPQNRPHDHQAVSFPRENPGLKRSSSSIGFVSRLVSDPRVTTGYRATPNAVEAVHHSEPHSGYEGAEVTFRSPLTQQKTSSVIPLARSQSQHRISVTGSMTIGDDPGASRSAGSNIYRHTSSETKAPPPLPGNVAASQEHRKLKLAQRLAAGGAASSRADAVLKDLLSSSSCPEQTDAARAKERKAKLDSLLKFGAELREKGCELRRYEPSSSFLPPIDN